MSGDSRHERPDKRDEENEHLQRIVKELELEAQGKRQRRDHEEHTKGSVSIESGHREASHQFGSHRHKYQSQEYADRDSISLKGR